jgi:molybdopterin-containing oxidoreductase family iron-sulfur binding subunit
LDQKVSSSTKWAVNVEVDKCVEGCTACVEACVDENGLYGFDRPETDSQWIRKLMIKDIKTDKITTLPMMCQHCENPPCCDVCPTIPSSLRKDAPVGQTSQHGGFSQC